ncbi:MAG: TetR/AcrR family transcriptional regulator [Chloroflexi bacterium]|nr:TetR/AcrR family transcriptional regulator [Chloroflexota bacterium]
MSRLTPNARRALVEERKAQILAAAVKVFSAKGFERARIADIARQAGVAEGSIYNYFKNKGDLLVSIPRHAIEPAVTTVRAQAAPQLDTDASPEQILTDGAQTLVATIRQNAHIFRILVTALPSMNQATRQSYLEQVVLYGTSLIEGIFREQIKQGRFRRDLDPAVAARGFIGMFFPFVMLRDILQVDVDPAWDYDQVIPELVTLFLRGALADPRERKAR